MDPHWRLPIQNQTCDKDTIIHSSNNSSQFRLEALNERWQILLTTLYSLTAITSFILNVITVIVLARYRHSELRKYLINLSVSDLLMSLFSIPFTYTEYMLGRWVFAPFLCPLVRFVVILSVFVSVATMTVIGINRHLAVMYPFREKACSSCYCAPTRMRKSHVIAAIWLIGIAISAPEYLMHRLVPFAYNGQCYFECRQVWPPLISKTYTVFIFLCTFAIPLSILSYLYIRIGLKLWRHQMPGNVDINRDLTMQTTRAKVIKMLLVVVIMFAVSWLPLQTFFLINLLFPQISQLGYDSLEYYIFIGTYFVSHWLSMAHSCLNPLIYCFMNDNFRSDLQNLLCKRNRRHLKSFTSMVGPRPSLQAANGHHHHHQQQPHQQQQQQKHMQPSQSVCGRMGSQRGMQFGSSRSRLATSTTISSRERPAEEASSPAANGARPSDGTSSASGSRNGSSSSSAAAAAAIGNGNGSISTNSSAGSKTTAIARNQPPIERKGGGSTQIEGRPASLQVAPEKSSQHHLGPAAGEQQAGRSPTASVIVVVVAAAAAAPPAAAAAAAAEGATQLGPDGASC